MKKKGKKKKGIIGVGYLFTLGPFWILTIL